MLGDLSLSCMLGDLLMLGDDLSLPLATASALIDARDRSPRSRFGAWARVPWAAGIQTPASSSKDLSSSTRIVRNSRSASSCLFLDSKDDTFSSRAFFSSCAFANPSELSGSSSSVCASSARPLISSVSVGGDAASSMVFALTAEARCERPEAPVTGGRDEFTRGRRDTGFDIRGATVGAARTSVRKGVNAAFAACSSLAFIALLFVQCLAARPIASCAFLTRRSMAISFVRSRTSAPLTGLAVVAIRMMEWVRLISYPSSPKLTFDQKAATRPPSE
mmetsp:Transcript_17047/g.39915  ORF Transcript_17047/g.39915 Transcript_17047/m.39915 type:complete len:277 (-) Transcript_17047:4186-5016(-)